MIVIIDYGMGNVGSVKNAIEALGGSAAISGKKDDLENSSHIILPGVGAFGDGMKNLREAGLVDILSKEVLEKKKPFLGLCLGMQLLADKGEEGGEKQGLGWIKGRVRRFSVDESKFKVPHIGWNDVFALENAKLFAGIKRSIFYFVHSFHLVLEEENIATAYAEHGERFVAAVEKDNIFGLQFHPEKSQKEGLKVLENFLKL